MITKIAVIISLVTAYLLIGFLLLFVINKLYCLVFDEVLFDEDVGTFFVFLYPICISCIFVDLIFGGVHCAIERINDSILGHSKQRR